MEANFSVREVGPFSSSFAVFRILQLLELRPLDWENGEGFQYLITPASQDLSQQGGFDSREA
jgi:hypothetical protein